MASSSAVFFTSKRMVMLLRPPARSLPESSFTRTRAVVSTVATSSTMPSLVRQSSSRVVSKGCSSWELQRTRTQREELERQMEQAVAVEDFETAAALRDRLRALSEKEAAQ